MQQTTQPQIKEIPSELAAHIEAIVDLTKQKAWITAIYYNKIVPFIDSLIRVQTFRNREITLHELYILKSYFSKNKQTLSEAQRANFIHLRNAIKISDALARDIEYSFFVNVAKRRSGFSIDSFLPDTFRRHLRSILEIQILLFIESELKNLCTPVNESQRQKLYQWVRKELNIKKGENKSENSSIITDFTHTSPSLLYYFFNGAQHLFILHQLEGIQLRAVANDWLKWKQVLMKERFSMKDLLTLLTVPTTKFIFYLFYLSLFPYRTLRTAVNQLSNYSADKLQEIMLNHFPNNSKKKTWTALKIVFQMSLYVSLILSVGLPLFPLPLIWLPELLMSKWLLAVPLLYSASILTSGTIARLLGKKPTTELRVTPPNSLENIQQTVEPPTPRSFVVKMPSHTQLKRPRLNLENAETKKTTSRIHPG